MRTPSRPTIPDHAGIRTGFGGHGNLLVNLVEPGDTVIVCRNGVFGWPYERERSNVMARQRSMFDDAWGNAVDPNKLEDVLRPSGKRVSWPSCTPKRPPAHSRMRKHWWRSHIAIIAFHRRCRDLAGRLCRCGSMNGASMQSIPAARSACRARRDYRRKVSASARWRPFKTQDPCTKLVHGI